VVKAPEAWIGYLEEEAGNRGVRERKREDE
jgi:hypothetical protein